MKIDFPFKLPRLSEWVIIAIVLLGAIAILNPMQLPVVLYKCALMVLAFPIAYWLDRRMFPYARPHQTPAGYLRQLAMLRRTIIVLACVLGLTLGL